MTALRFARLAAAALALSGLIAVPGARAQPAAEGTVLIRVSLEGLKYVNKFVAEARPAGGGDTVDLQGWGFPSDGYWSRYYEDGEKGQLVVAKLPAGDYELFSFYAAASAWGGTRTVRPAKPISHRFRVEAGEAVYLGNLHVRFTGDTGVVSPQYVVVDDKRIGVDVRLRDSRERDLAEAVGRDPDLAPERVRVRLLK